MSQLEDIQDVLVGLIAEVSIKIQFKWNDTQDEVLVIEQVFDRLVLHEMVLDR